MTDKKEIEITETNEDVSPPEDGEEAVEEAVAKQADEQEKGTDPEEELSVEEQLRQKVAELEDKLLRQRAEFENYRKRSARQYDSAAASARERVLNDLLEVVDSFERAEEHIAGEVDLSSVQKGFELIRGQIDALMQRYDVKAIESVGKPFDPNSHEAMMSVASDEHPEGEVALEMARGYRIGDRVLRYSKVGVSTGPEKQPKGDQDKGGE